MKYCVSSVVGESVTFSDIVMLYEQVRTCRLYLNKIGMYCKLTTVTELGKVNGLLQWNNQADFANTCWSMTHE